MILSRRKLIGIGAAGAGGLLLGGCDRLNDSETVRGALNGATANASANIANVVKRR